MDTILYQKRHKKKKTSLDDLLCEELLEQILFRLESETIIRCKSVCKRWLSMISSPEFINRHVEFQQSVTPISSRFYLADLHQPYPRHSPYRLDICKEASSSSSSSSFKSFNFYPKHPTRRPSWRYAFNLVGSWNGLVLCSERASLKEQSRYHVCNPITRDWLILLPPPPRPPHARCYDPGCALIDDDGSITTTGGFKVVLIYKESAGYFDVSSFSTSTGMEGHSIIGYDSYKPSDECSYIELPPPIRYALQLYLGVNQGRIMVSLLVQNL
ncbi:hypothetical protein Tsubulata_048095 [Turnera subulata]|uniref:F-box domain-containing protein n=1 Tax=Turnera subulata TaxID=218843 RepID=A0A9Q0G3D1_9ROSI|nr:hypothetical protein Tsubulata_048095 [Turnera subulata]